MASQAAQDARWLSHSSQKAEGGYLNRPPRRTRQTTGCCGSAGCQSAREVPRYLGGYCIRHKRLTTRQVSIVFCRLHARVAAPSFCAAFGNNDCHFKFGSNTLTKEGAGLAARLALGWTHVPCAAPRYHSTVTVEVTVGATGSQGLMRPANRSAQITWPTFRSLAASRNGCPQKARWFGQRSWPKLSGCRNGQSYTGKELAGQTICPPACHMPACIGR